MDIDRFKGGIIFNWMNKNEIYNKYNGFGKKQNVQSYIDKLHVDYIATRKGVDKSAHTHGLFGNILGTDNVEILELEDIKKYIQGKSNENIDIFKTVISLREEDAMQYGFLNQKAWKNLLQERTFEIARAFKIPINDMEWVAAFHAKKGQPHCHLVVWNKNQDLSVKRKPYIFYNDMRKVIAKGVYKEELEAEYNIKDISKKELGKLSQKEFEKLKENTYDFETTVCGKQEAAPVLQSRYGVEHEIVLVAARNAEEADFHRFFPEKQRRVLVGFAVQPAQFMQQLDAFIFRRIVLLNQALTHTVFQQIAESHRPRHTVCRFQFTDVVKIHIAFPPLFWSC